MIEYCSKCLMPNTRPRITFNEKKVCNACIWSVEKKTIIDWDKRWNELVSFSKKFQSERNSEFDVIIPVSGGKDSCYVAYKMKNDLNLHPLLLHVEPPLPFEIGNRNLDRLISNGFDCIKISPNPDITKLIAKRELFDFGDPLLSWMIPVRAALFKIAIKFNIKWIMWGEDGEVEYGGLSQSKNTPIHDLKYELNYLLSKNNPTKYLDTFSKQELSFWLLPSEKEFQKAGIVNMHMNYFDSWDPYRNYLIAKEHFGLEEKKSRNLGTYTNFAQTDSALFDLHCYLMYLKFGFGRCTADACIDIRRGALDRIQAIELVKKFDNAYPEPFVELYLDFFSITKEELNEAFDKHANKNLFEKINDKWVPKFEVK